MPDVLVIFPWRGGDIAREIAYGVVQDHYKGRLYTGQRSMAMLSADANPAKPFSRADSRNRGASVSDEWQAVVFIDADCIVHVEILEEAIDRAIETNKVILPHDEFIGLTQEGSIKAMQEPNVARWDTAWADSDLPHSDIFLEAVGDPAHIAESRQRIKKPSGVIVFPKPAWDLIGGYDPRFQGWGFEDNAILWAAEDLAWGWDRIAGRLWHLWHLPATDIVAEDKALFERYKQAHGNPRAMQSLVLEHRNVNDRLAV
jgi:hypothetical protein